MNKEIINWLLEEKEPSIRYRTLTELLDYPYDNKEVISAKEKVTNCKNVERIFSRTNDKNIFPHKPEYFGNWTTFNYLTALVELGITREDKRIWPIIDWILTPGDDKQEYFVQKELGYAYLLDTNNLGSCRQVSFLCTLVRLGYLDDPRVKKLIEAFMEKSRFDGGYLCKWKKSRHEGKEPKSCYIATVPALMLYSVLPKSYRKGKKYNGLINYFKSRNIIYSKIEPEKMICQPQFSFNFSLPQILMVAYSMGKLGMGNIPEMEGVWEILESKPTVDGKYILEYEETKKAILMDKKGQPNKWITFYMLLAQKYKEKSG
jgi:hypothetical protein